MKRNTTSAPSFSLRVVTLLSMFILAEATGIAQQSAPTSVAKTPAKKECFAADGDNLRAAVKIHLAEAITGDIVQEKQKKEIQSRYGADMRQWCVDQVEDFSLVFANQETFNLDISSWNVTRGQSFASMFQGASAFDQSLCAWGLDMISNPSTLQQNTPKIQGHNQQKRPSDGRFSVPNVDKMFAGSGCPEEVTPLFMSSSNDQKDLSEEPFVFVTSFCQPCDNVDDVTEKLKVKEAIEQEVSSASLASPQARPTSLTSNGNLKGNQTESQHEALMASIAAVHSHESAARGAHFVFLLMITVFAVNGALLAILQRPSRVRRQEAYTQLSLMSNNEDDDNMPANDLEGARDEMELADFTSAEEQT